MFGNPVINTVAKNKGQMPDDAAEDLNSHPEDT